jgi:gluconokinase
VTHVLALDAGSSSVRAALYDSDARVVPGTLTQIDIDLSRFPGGVAQLDAVYVREALEQAIDGTLASQGAAGAEIAVVAMTTFWHSGVLIDPHGAPLTAVLTWADTRSERDAVALRAALDANAVHQRTGCILHPSYLPAKIAWLQRHDPDLFGRAAGFVSFPQYCTGVWLGSTATSVSMASGSGLYNDRAGTWDAELLEHLELSATLFGEFVPDPELMPAVLDEYARRWPALRDVPWRAPIGDGASSNLGSGCVVPERLALMVGTSGALRRCEAAQPGGAVPEGLWRYLLDRKHVVTGGALSDGGSVYAWLRDTLQLPSEEECEAELARRQPGQHGIVVLPFWSGERALGWVGDATAVLSGLKAHTTPLDIFQAALEGVTYRFAALFDTLSRGGETVVATGGGLRSSPAWLQLMADALGTTVVASNVSESSLRGAALLALRDVGLLDTDTFPPAPYGDAYVSRAGQHAAHREARERQRMLYEREVGPDGVNLLARQTR